MDCAVQMKEGELRVFQERLAWLRQDRAVIAALKERHAKMILELLNLLRQGGLRHTKHKRRF